MPLDKKSNFSNIFLEFQPKFIFEFFSPSDYPKNSSELLNFLRQDRYLVKETEDTQEELAQTVQLAFKYLVHALEENLLQQMPAFLSSSNDDLPSEDGSGMDTIPMPYNPQPTMYDIIQMLNNAMSLLRRCRVNAALTIQLFSQLFHFINMFLFNEVITRLGWKLFVFNQL